MKKLIALVLVAAMVSCSSEDETNQVGDAKSSDLSVLDGNLLSYKDDASFIKEYSALTELKTGTDLQNWISKKGHSPLLNATDETEQDEQEVNTISESSKNVYSDAISAVFNKEAKVKVNGKVLWLHEQNLYELNESDLDKNSAQLEASKSDLKLYGNIFGESKSSATGRNIANANKSLGWEYGFRWDGRERRLTLLLFNETIYLNGDVKTTKMFLRAERLGKYCSTWKCRWNSDANGVINIRFNGYANWTLNPNISNPGGYIIDQNTNTVLFADGTRDPNTPIVVVGSPPDFFAVSGTVTSVVTNVPVIQFQPLTTSWAQQISWY